MIRPVLFSALPSSGEGSQNISFHELSTSNKLHQLKLPPNSAFISSSNNKQLPPRKSVAFLPSTNSIGSTIVTISGRDSRNGLLVWSALNGKPTPSHRLIPPMRVVVLALSPSGTYLSTGSADGGVMLWELSTGTLLATFDAHYKSITCLSFSDDEAALVTTSEDSTCSVWSIPTLIDEAFNSNLSHTPYSIFSDHTLPISDVFISRGSFPDLRIFTASLDQTIKIWSPLFPAAPLLSTFAVPGPAHHLVVDPLERFIIVAYAVVLKEEAGQEDMTKNQPPEDVKVTASAVRIIPLFARPTHSASQGGTSRVHASAGLVQPADTASHENIVYTSPRSTQITALHLPSSVISNSVILCGLSTGKIVHLSLHSLQPLGQTIPHHPHSAHESSSDPVVGIATFLRPPDLLSSSSTSDSHRGSDGPNTALIANRPIGVLGRTVGKNGDDHRIVGSLSTSQSQHNFKRDLTTMIKFEDSHLDRGLLEDDDPFSLPGNIDQHLLNSIFTHPSTHQLIDSNHHSNQNSTALNQKLKNHSDLVDRLTAESVQLKVQLNQALAFNDAMWSGIVDGTLKFNQGNPGSS